MNVGIGHRFSHSKDSYVDVKTMNEQIAKFRQFYNKHKDTKFIRDENPYSIYNDDYEDYIYVQRTYEGICDICGLTTDVAYIFDHTICQDCFETLVTQYCYLHNNSRYSEY